MSSAGASLEIRNHTIGAGHAPLVVIDVSRHSGAKVRAAEKMVRIAQSMGADAVRFEIASNDPTALSLDDHRCLRALCDKLDMVYVATPVDAEAWPALTELRPDCLQLSARDLDDPYLASRLTNLPAALFAELDEAHLEGAPEKLARVRSNGLSPVALYAPRATATRYDQIDLFAIPKLAAQFSGLVGLADTSRGIYIALGAVALGATVIEKSLILDRADGNDASALEPYDVEELVKGVRAVFEANGSERTIYPEEQQIVAWARESVVSEMNIAKGTKIEPHMVWVKRPAPESGSIPAKDLKKVVGRIAATDITADRQIKWADLQ